ncbi:MAG: RimK/LysX family protein [bacterium]|nr:RimK/LysX family protein [bacterium]
MIKAKSKKILGSSDKIDFPELGFENISCKIDTGADTSSIHCHHVRIREIDGEEVLVFRLLDPKHKAYVKKDCTTKQFKEKRIKNSFGDKEYRYFVILKIKLFNQEIEAEFSLANRSDMTYPVLLGKKLLYQQYLVDISQKNLSYSAKKNHRP